MKEYSSTRPSNPHRGDTMHEQRLARAIDYQTKVVEHLQRLPLIQEVADHVGVCASALCRWPEFAVARRRIAKTKHLENRGRHTGNEDLAIDFQTNYVKQHGHLPMCKDVATAIGVSHCRSYRWPRFAAARHALENDLRLAAANDSLPTAAHVQGEFGFSKGCLAYWKKHGCSYLNGRSPTVQKVRRSGRGTQWMQCWLRSEMEAIQTAIDQAPDGQYSDSVGTWLSAPEVYRRYQRLTDRTLRRDCRIPCHALDGQKLRSQRVMLRVRKRGWRLVTVYPEAEVQRLLIAQTPKADGIHRDDAGEWLPAWLAAAQLGVGVMTFNDWRKWCSPLHAQVSRQETLRPPPPRPPPENLALPQSRFRRNRSETDSGCRGVLQEQRRRLLVGRSGSRLPLRFAANLSL